MLGAIIYLLLLVLSVLPVLVACLPLIARRHHPKAVDIDKWVWLLIVGPIAIEVVGISLVDDCDTTWLLLLPVAVAVGLFCIAAIRRHRPEMGYRWMVAFAVLHVIVFVPIWIFTFGPGCSVF